MDNGRVGRVLDGDPVGASRAQKLCRARNPPILQADRVRRSAAPRSRLRPPDRTRCRSTSAAVTSRARSSSSAWACSPCQTCLAADPSSAASVTPAPSFHGWRYFAGRAFAFARRLHLAQRSDLPARRRALADRAPFRLKRLCAVGTAREDRRYGGGDADLRGEPVRRGEWELIPAAPARSWTTAC
jgi:hypothetical protein